MNPQFACFGYGSLVNDQTRHPRESRTIDCRLKGFRREWRAVTTREGPGHCALSIRPDAGSEIDGVLVVEPTRKLPALDKREAQYDRLALQRTQLTLLRSDPLHAQLSKRAIVYRAKRVFREWGSDRAPMMQSYVDVVMKGFLLRFGEAGLRRFMDTTDGWDQVPILADRKKPLYPRAVRLTGEEREFFHDLARDHGARFISTL